MQHADLGVPNSPFQGLLEYTPPPPYGTHIGHKQANNDDDQRKPTELAQNATLPKDIQMLALCLLLVGIKAKRIWECFGDCWSNAWQVPQTFQL